jgi:hypothetical protein
MARLRLALLAGLVLAATGLLAAQEKDDKEAPQPAPAGSWKVTAPTLEAAGGQPLLLVRLAKKDGKWSGDLVASNLKGKGTIEKVSVRDKALRFTVQTPALTWACVIKLPGDTKAGKLYGETTFRGGTLPLEMERTTLTSLDPFDLNRESLAKEPPGVAAIGLALNLLRSAEEKKVKPAEARSWAEKAVKSADLYGPGFQRNVLLNIANVLGEQKDFVAVALQYARRAERGLDDKEGPAAQKRVLSVLADVLEQAGKKDEAGKIRARLAKLDFRVKPKTYAGRKAKNKRVVLAEMFTGSQANPTVATTLATTALLKTFKPTELALIEYHLHLTQPDPLACEEGEERFAAYRNGVKGLPVLVFNGRLTVPNGGGAEDAQERYENYVESTESLLEEAPKAELSVKASRKGGKVIITAEVSKVAVKSDDVRLRLVLVEPTVRYKGLNGQAVHHNVARAMPGGVEGFALKGKTTKKTVTVDLALVRKKINEYLDKVKKKRDFPDKQRPLEMKQLRVIAFVQNDAKGEVLQAAQVDVPAAE